MIQDGRWTPEQDAQLRTLWGVGKTASQIMTLMGLYSRGQVIGRVHRLKLAKRANPARKSFKMKPLSKASLLKARIAVKALVAEAKVVPLQVPVARQLTFRLHPTHKCRWITTDERPWVFCDSACREGSSYCPDHHARAYQPKVQAAE